MGRMATAISGRNGLTMSARADPTTTNTAANAKPTSSVNHLTISPFSRRRCISGTLIAIEQQFNAIHTEAAPTGP